MSEINFVTLETLVKAAKLEKNYAALERIKEESSFDYLHPRAHYPMTTQLKLMDTLIALNLDIITTTVTTDIRHKGYYEIGYCVPLAYSRTMLGRLITAAMSLLSFEQILYRLPDIYRYNAPTTSVFVHKLAEHHFSIVIKNTFMLADFDAGLLQSLLDELKLKGEALIANPEIKNKEIQVRWVSG